MSCNNKSSQRNRTDCKLLNLDGVDSNQKHYSDLFSDEELIFLASSKFLVRNVVQAKYFNNKIFVLDNTHKLYIFADDGKELAVINNRGSGAHEYLEIKSFDIDRSKDELVLNTFPEKLMRYSFDATFISETKIPIRATTLATINEDAVALYTQNINNTGSNKNFNLYVLSEKKVSQPNGFVHIQPLGGRLLPVFQYMDVFARFEAENQTLFIHPFSNQILLFDSSNRPVVKYEIVSNKEPFINLCDKNSLQTYSELELKMKNKNIYGTNSYWENNRWVHFSLKYQGKFSHFIFDKKEKSYIGYQLQDDIFGVYPTPIYANEDFLFCFVDAETILSLEEYLSLKKQEPSKKMKKIIQTIKETENPLFFKLYFNKR